MSIAEVQYAQLEARYYDIDFAALTFRKALNIVESCLRESQGGDEVNWNRNWADIFDPELPDEIPDAEQVEAFGIMRA